MGRRVGFMTLVLVGLAGCGKSSSTTSPAATVTPAVGGQPVQATAAGFVPSTIAASAGVPCTLMVTRTTDMTCAREFLMPMQSIDEPLPLNQTVMIRFTPMQPGNIPFSCQMGMMNGMVAVK